MQLEPQSLFIDGRAGAGGLGRALRQPQSRHRRSLCARSTRPTSAMSIAPLPLPQAAFAGLGRDGRRGARPDPAPGRRPPARASRRAGPAGGAGYRQADQRGAGGRHRQRRGLPRLLRRLRARDRRRACRSGRAGFLLHPPRALGRVRRHRRLELSAADRLLEVGPCPCLRQHDGVQAVGADAGHGVAAGRDLRRGRACRPACSTSCRATPAPGRRWCAIRGVAKVSLTGEASTGSRVMADAAATLKQVTLELGGKSPLIVFADADLENAVSAAMLANFYTQGEVCSNGTRVFVERGLHNAFIDRLRRAHRADGRRRPARPRDACRCPDQPGAHGARARLCRGRPGGRRAAALRRRAGQRARLRRRLVRPARRVHGLRGLR